jgi:hypothetical protein
MGMGMGMGMGMDENADFGVFRRFGNSDLSGSGLPFN